jgi:hypothetical protein
MDLTQRKLTKAEWDSIEIPVSKGEKDILKLITAGYHNVQIGVNNTSSIFTYLKIEYSTAIEDFLYSKFFADKIQTLVGKYKIACIIFSADPDAKRGKREDTGISISADNICYISVSTLVRLKSGDQIRMSRLTDESLMTNELYELVLYGHLEQMVANKSANNNRWMYYYYTLHHLLQNNVAHVNRFIRGICSCVLANYESDLQLQHILENSVEYIEKNANLLKYGDLTLYTHQKTIYTVVKSPTPKLVLYIAPTGTGKTLTPLGLSEQHKIIFVCAARHVGLALARSAISINKRIAFAFGCSSAEDVRLHYFAATDYTTNKRSGQIQKVDNTVGDKVEIMICDIRSYIPAMYYMLAFNPARRIITYWDEPTITMDYQSHELHDVIKQNWKENVIPNMVLSSATLPKQHELTHTIADFQEKFKGSVVHNIVSHDCRKTIPLLDNNGYVVMPHYLSSDYSKIVEIANHCEENMTLLRYLDLQEISKFVRYIDSQNLVQGAAKMDRNFTSVGDITMTNIKMYYIKCLKNIDEAQWAHIYNYLQVNRTKMIKYNGKTDTIVKATSLDSATALKQAKAQMVSVTEPPNSAGVYITTKDSYTLTDGPTIFLANDLQKIAKFCIQQSNIPAHIMKDIMDKIEYNNQINQRIDQLERDLEVEEAKITAKLGGSSADTSKEAKGLKGKKDGKKQTKIANKLLDKTEDKSLLKIHEEIANLKSLVKHASLDDVFIPNKLPHLSKWAPADYSQSNNKPFTSTVDEDYITDIMLLKDVDDNWKILLLLGIGVFTKHRSSTYSEIMKKLADSQKLYLIIADSDYIYGTNYQFCHGYLSKDMTLTQEKIIQALGRIGRNNIQQQYSARFRDDSQITTLFTSFASEDKPEVINMNQLFNCRNVKWNGSDYLVAEAEAETETSV